MCGLFVSCPRILLLRFQSRKTVSGPAVSVNTRRVSEAEAGDHDGYHFDPNGVSPQGTKVHHGPSNLMSRF
jgi:hypothetical protein